MKRLIFVLSLCALLLAGCAGEGTKPPSPDGPVPPADGGISLAELNVEFTAGGDADGMKRLKKELPPLLIDALAARDVQVGRVNVTFGASEEAAAGAIAQGTVQVGFVPTETYLEHEDTMRPVSACMPSESERLENSAVWCAGRTERGEALFQKAGNGQTADALTWEDVKDASWLICGGFAREWIDAYLYARFDGHTTDDLSNAVFVPGGETDGAEHDLIVTAPGGAEDAAQTRRLDGGELCPTVAVVSTADAILNSDEFVTALAAALSDESMEPVLPLFGAESCVSMTEGGDGLLDGARLLYDRAHGSTED